jgi:hypothetical protein
MTTRKTCLYLFSSNQSALYAQDILNVLGAPEGHLYRFRYDAKYVEPSLVSQWESLQDTPVLVLFSLQQRARFQPPAFIPIRAGYVVHTHREGNSLFVDFRITTFACIPDSVETEGEQVIQFTKMLEGWTDAPYSVSASLGSLLPGKAIDTEGDASVLFSRTASFLAQTATFQDAYFVRVLGIRPVGQSKSDAMPFLSTTEHQPYYKLKARTSYELVFFHAQLTAPSEPAEFRIFVDPTKVHLLTEGQFFVASKYDEVLVPLVTATTAGLEDLDSVIAVQPETGVQGPAVQVRIKLEADRARAYGTAAAQSLALVLVALAGILSSTPTFVRLLLAVFGAVAAAWIGLVGASALRAPALPTSSPHSATH